MTKVDEFSLSDLNARKQADTPFEFPFLRPDGTKTGVTLLVLGAQSETVMNETNRIINERRATDAQRELMQTGIGAPPVTPVEVDIEFTQKLTAVRLVGWKGIKEPWSKENALLLIKSNPQLADQVTKQSANIGNFTGASPTA